MNQQMQMCPMAIKAIVDQMKESTLGKQDGTRVHLHYRSFRQSNSQAITDAERSTELGLPKDRYTGRVDKIRTSNKGDLLLTMLVELERDHKYRTFNLDKGSVFKIVILGD